MVFWIEYWENRWWNSTRIWLGSMLFFTMACIILYSSPSASILIKSIFLFILLATDWIEITSTWCSEFVEVESSREQEVGFPLKKTGIKYAVPVKSETAFATCFFIDKPALLSVISEIWVGSNVYMSALYFS